MNILVEFFVFRAHIFFPGVMEEFANELKQTNASTPLWVSLVSGGVAGTFTDITLFPLDTVKTRLQSGSLANRQLVRGLYQGIGPAALASAPSAALFFGTYEFAKKFSSDSPFGHGQAAIAGEIVSALFKVPFEVVKQRLQANSTHSSAWQVFIDIYRREGYRGCYAGLGATLAREIPFGFIQMPLYEFFKKIVQQNTGGSEVTSLQACGCGAVAGGIAAAATCPVDVWKTRLMLGDPNATIFSIARKEGVRALFSGVVPRVVWISVGGSVFFGAYEGMRSFLLLGGGRTNS